MSLNNGKHLLVKISFRLSCHPGQIEGPGGIYIYVYIYISVLPIGPTFILPNLQPSEASEQPLAAPAAGLRCGRLKVWKVEGWKDTIFLF